MSYDAIIKTFPLNYDQLSHYKEINTLIKENLEQNSLPFNNNLPLPLDTNVITGKHFGDIHQQKIELKAASIGSKRNLWIYGADAQYLGLELKSAYPSEYQKAKKECPNFNCSPIIVQANIKERLFVGKGNASNSNVVSEGLGTDCQCAYLIDQFTENSLQKVFSLASLNRKLGDPFSPVKERCSLIAKEIIKNINEYNTGEKEQEKRNNIKKNFTLNLNKNSPSFVKAKDKMQEITANYTKEQKIVFGFYYNHFKEQLTGDKYLSISTNDKTQLHEAFSTLLKDIDNNTKKSNIITQTVFDAYTFTERLSHHNFSLEPVYTLEEQKEKEKLLRTDSIRNDSSKEIKTSSIIDESAKQKLRNRTYGLKIDQEQGL